MSCRCSLGRLGRKSCSPENDGVSCRNQPHYTIPAGLQQRAWISPCSTWAGGCLVARLVPNYLGVLSVLPLSCSLSLELSRKLCFFFDAVSSGDAMLAREGAPRHTAETSVRSPETIVPLVDRFPFAGRQILCFARCSGIISPGGRQRRDQGGWIRKDI